MRSLTFLILTVSSATVAVGQQPDKPRCRDCATTAEGRASTEARLAQMRDSLRARAGFEGEIESVAAQLLMVTPAAECARARRSTALLSGQSAEANRSQVEVAVRRLREQIDQAAQRSQMLRTQLASLCDRNAKPRGLHGHHVLGDDARRRGSVRGEIFRFAENPTVETVEPGSPAERAGVAKGDEIILIDGQSVVGRDIVFNQLLRPGTRLPLRVRRDGDTRDVLLVIKQRPPSLDNGCPFLDARIMAAFGDPISIAQLPISGAIVRAAPLPPAVTPPLGCATCESRRPPEADQRRSWLGAVNGVVTVMPAPARAERTNACAERGSRRRRPDQRTCSSSPASSRADGHRRSDDRAHERRSPRDVRREERRARARRGPRITRLRLGPQGRRHHRVRRPNRRDVAVVDPARDRERRWHRSFRFASSERRRSSR